MRVKRLEIQGFKSFKDKTVIHFDDGVTGIVGPNGCGKSNIVDSFFWVMGEQSTKHMRATGQEDLIFNGSEKYAPLSMAEVTMVLATGASQATLPEGMSNRDLPPHLRYEEISVTRRLFRDGESEYLINGATCRLKDIHELFMDTGAGPKAYSIIEQGQIARIVQSKPEERRTLIEEAAGIVKFKARKKESLRKIEATRQNLLRINDIVTEIERQLGSLERQASKARQYKKIKEELVGKEVLVGRKKLHYLKQNTATMQSRVQELDMSEFERRNALQMAELQIENLKIQLSEAQRIADDGQNALQALQREVSQDDTKVQLHRRNIQELESSNQTLDEEKEELLANIEMLEQESERLAAEATELESLFKNADGVLKEHQERLDAAKAEADDLGRSIEGEKRELMADLGRRNEISNQVHGLEAKVDSFSVQINGMASKISDREFDHDMWKERATKARGEFEVVDARTQILRGQVDTLRGEIQTLEPQLKEARVNDSRTREERAKAEAKQKALQQLIDNHEGFRADVKNILSDDSYANSLKGLFADGLEAFPGYEFALEGLLRDYLENLFIEDSSQARALIEGLKEKNQGRATFWAMDLLSNRAAQVGTSGEELARQVSAKVSGVKRMIDVIRLDHSASEQVLKLFDRHFVVDSLAEAIDGFKATSDLGCVFVTREGDVVDYMGRVSGGSTKSLEGGILSRKAELHSVTEQLTGLVAKAEELSALVHSLETTLSEKSSEHEKLSRELRDSEQNRQALEKELVLSESQFKSVEAELSKLKEESTTLQANRSELWGKLDQIRQELSGMEGSTREREQRIEEKSREHNVLVQNAGQLQGAMIQLKVDFAASQEKYRNGKQNAERVSGELEDDRNRLEEVERMMNRKLDERDMLSQELIGLEDRLRSNTERSQTLESQLKERKNEIEKLNIQMSQAFEAQRESMRAVEEGSSELSRLKLDVEKGLLEYQMLLQNLFEKYGLEEAGIAPQNEEDQRAFDELDADRERELSEEVDRLRDKLRKLGEVNLMAVEEYDEQKKRHEFLISQREDLLKSIADLEKAIERINKTSEERFRVAFVEINTRFQRIFPIVFGGGQAKLELTNPEDINETGVDIMAEPPGKKLGSIQLMSGGEKALTAVALIFSIFLIKPSPFCVLDEVDAPLDDHNVGKFNALLKEMAVKSQFIIITHNKRTMELNDKLYGVTMEEPGVSKMVSIEVQ